MAGLNTDDIGDFLKANELQSYRFVENNEDNVVLEKYPQAFQRLKPFMELIAFYEQGEDIKLWEKFNEISGKNYEPTAMGQPRLHSFNSLVACMEDQEKTSMGHLFLELFSEVEGVKTPLMYTKFEVMKMMGGQIVLFVRCIAANDGGVFEDIKELVYNRKYDRGQLKFAQNPRGHRVADPLITHLREYFVHPKMGLQSQSAHLTKSRLGNVRNDMYENLDVFALCDDFINADENLLILSGPPGTGKTTVIKALIHRMWYAFNKDAIEAKDDDGDRYLDVDTLYVKDIKVLETAEFWSFLNMKSEGFDLLIFDDVDIVLQNRVGKDGKKADFSEIVNQLLSLSNGFIKHDVKILVTSNLSIANIDPAIMRPGRCYDVLDMPKMSIAHARKLWVDAFELQDKDFPFAGLEKDNSVTQASLMSEVARMQRNPKRYFLNGANYSVRDKA